MLNDGIALGHVVLHEPRVVITNFIADDVPKEIKRLEAAVETMRSDLDVPLERGEVADGGEHRDVLEAYRMLAYDRGCAPPEEAVATGLTSPRPRSSAFSRTPAPACCAPPTPICASACTTSTSSPTG